MLQIAPPSFDIDTLKTVKVAAPEVDVGSVAAATVDVAKVTPPYAVFCQPVAVHADPPSLWGCQQSIASGAVATGAVVGQAAVGTAQLAGEGLVTTVKGVADGTVAVVGGTARTVGAVAGALGKTAADVGAAAPSNLQYLSEKTNYLKDNFSNGVQELQAVIKAAPTEIEKIKAAPIDTAAAPEILKTEVAPKVCVLLFVCASKHTFHRIVILRPARCVCV